MKTRIITAKDSTLTHEELALIKQTIRGGGLCIIPTETVYGLGADATNPDAAMAIYSAKDRPSNNPLIIHIASPEDASKYCITSDIYERLASAFMPGPLTVILPKRDVIPLEVTGGLSTVAVRCPSHPVAAEIIRACGVPIAAPSANRSGRPSPTCARYCIEDMDGRVDVIVDGGDCEIGLESTIVMPEADGSIVLLRPGKITVDEIAEATGATVRIAKGVLEEIAKDTAPLSPGMMYKHYAPKTEFVLLDGSDEEIFAYVNGKTEKCAFLALSGDEEKLSERVKTVNIGKREDPLSQAQRIFSALREADELGCDVIFSRLPGREGIELALFNRLIRASAHRIIDLNKK
jgi:L-threonylcarbamoyladenylate synthase